jgi:multisubunit Na+/H+ antiporter MnhB subunit
MADEKESQKSAAIAAAIILVVAFVALYFMPKIVLWIGKFSPDLGVAAGVAIIACFFLVFWVRSKFQKR